MRAVSTALELRIAAGVAAFHARLQWLRRVASDIELVSGIQRRPAVGARAAGLHQRVTGEGCGNHQCGAVVQRSLHGRSLLQVPYAQVCALRVPSGSRLTRAVRVGSYLLHLTLQRARLRSAAMTRRRRA